MTLEKRNKGTHLPVGGRAIFLCNFGDAVKKGTCYNNGTHLVGRQANLTTQCMKPSFQLTYGFLNDIPHALMCPEIRTTKKVL